MADYTENRQFEINFYMSAKVVSPKNVDLMQLVPESFKDSVMLQDFLDQCGQLVGTWMTAVDELDHLVDPYLVGEDYIVYLAGNLGLDLITDEETTLDEKRKQLLNAIAWIKTKGTYEALIAQSHSNNLTPWLTDYYVSNVYGDYDDFTTYVGFSADDSESWFVAKYPGGNPSGLDSTYYKTPHFGFEILLDRAYILGDTDYLWSEGLSTKCTRILDSNRPINTVPHPGILLTPMCSEDGEVYTTAYLVATAVHSDWTTARFNLDMVDDGDVADTIGDLAIDDDTNQVVADVPVWYLDTGVTLDFASNPVITAVQRWRLGTGNRTRNILTDTFNTTVATPLAGHAPDYIEATGTTWTDASGSMEMLDGELGYVEGGYDSGSNLDLGIRASRIRYSTYISNSISTIWFRKNGPYYVGFDLSWVGHWRYMVPQSSGYGPIGDWTGGFVGWHDVEITDDGQYISVWVDGIKLVDQYETTLNNTYTGIGFARPAYLATTKFKDLTVEYVRSPGVGFAMETEVLSGTIDHIRIYTDRVEYEFEVPKAVVQAGISEMGLYTVADGLRVACTLPPIDKSDGFVLRVITTIYQGEVPV